MMQTLPGEMLVRSDGRDQLLALSEGFGEGHGVAVATDMAIAIESIDEAKASEACQRAEAQLRDKHSDEASVNASLVRSLVQLRVKRRRKKLRTRARNQERRTKSQESIH